MPEMANYALPVYQAVVSGLALKALQEEEARSQDRERLRKTDELLSEFDGLLEKFSKANFADYPRDGIGFIATGLALLVTVCREIIRTGMDELGEMPPQYQDEYKEKLARVMADVDQAEELAESWFMALDEEFVTSIRNSVEESKPIDSEDIPDWRDALARLQD